MSDPKVDTTNKDDIIDLSAPDEPAAAEPKATIKEAEEAGLDPREVEAGKKTGVIVADKPKDEGEGDGKGKEGEEKGKDGEEAKDGKKPAAKGKETPAERKREPKPWEKDITPEEKARIETFTPNEKALFYERKREKYRRQKAEDERDQLRAQVIHYKTKAETLESVKDKPAAEKPKEKEDDGTDLLDEYGQPKEKPKEGDDKPLTKADLDRIEKEKEAKTKKEKEDIEARRSAAVKTLNEQEAVFKEDHEDFDQVFEHTVKITNATKEEWEEMFPDPVQRRGVKSMVQDWLVALREPEKHTGENSAAALAYEIGKLHPEFSKGTDTGGEGADGSGEREDEGLDEDETKPPLDRRLDKQNRPSSASQNGGTNRKPISVHD